jgi:hypothetical protein
MVSSLLVNVPLSRFLSASSTYRAVMQSCNGYAQTKLLLLAYPFLTASASPKAFDELI